MSKQQEPVSLSTLRGTVAVITGAGNDGIGWGLCCHAAGKLGMHVVAIDLHESLVQSAQERLRQQYPQVESFGLVCDVTKPEDLAKCVDNIQSLLPGKTIGAVFANAGVMFSRTVLKSKPEEWAATLNINILGVVNTIQAFVPILQSQAFNSIFSATASVGGLVRGDHGGASYQASKHAVVAICESLSFELARKSPHISIHVLCPCIVSSGLHRSSAVNQKVSEGKLAAGEVVSAGGGDFALAMTPDRHAEQVFDHIADGNFYIITDNIRPYVDHDKPFNGLEIIKERYDNMMQLTLDNSDAFNSESGRPTSSIMKGPMFQPD